MAQALPTQVLETNTFQKFGKLPPEIRIRIWQYSMPEPRLIVIKSPFHTTSQSQESSSLADMLARWYDNSTSYLENSQGWRSRTPPPALLHVNAEARHEALKNYRLSLGVRDSAPRIYIDFERDTLFFGDTEIENACDALWAHTPDLGLAKRLAIVPEGAWRVLRWWEDMELNSLRKIVFVHGSEVLNSMVPLPALIEDAVVVDGEVDVGGDETNGAEGRPCDNERFALVTPRDSESPTELVQQQLQRDKKSQESTTTELPAETTSVEHVAPPRRRRSQEADTAALKRRQDARGELETLMSVLPTLWSKEPFFTTATFRAPGVVASA